MPTTFDALYLTLFVVLPGYVASRAWRMSASIRAPKDQHDRIGGILSWSAIYGAGTLLVLPEISRAIQDARDGTLVWWYGPALVLVCPFVVGWVAGFLVGSSPIYPRLIRWGLLDPDASTPWDDLVSRRAERSLQVSFRDADGDYIGEVKRSDSDGTRLYVTKIVKWSGTAWEDVDGYTGAMLIDSGKTIMWISEIDPKTGAIHDYRNEWN